MPSRSEKVLPNMPVLPDSGRDSDISISTQFDALCDRLNAYKISSLNREFPVSDIFSLYWRVGFPYQAFVNGRMGKTPYDLTKDEILYPITISLHYFINISHPCNYLGL